MHALQRGLSVTPIMERCLFKELCPVMNPTTFLSSHLLIYSQGQKTIFPEPELIQLKGSNEKPSLMYEIESASVLDSLQDVLGSQKARRYSDNIARAAAYVYRLIKEA
ncbi:jg27944 [Pararge aegeria aegeria]|uniref:Jg27944 protein n=1 Tax=Pararge aegeria aegeria TaxID=348720 RepID=A0A8S4QSW9_9NEOP|nr:jg27944 [Pararge aegeria aegeria]